MRGCCAWLGEGKYEGVWVPGWLWVGCAAVRVLVVRKVDFKVVEKEKRLWNTNKLQIYTPLTC
ncbi:hypothetical protein PAXRUDRAFT_822601 [Paxillus rubicundulus Ve08.2h10]|uniref:Unplaced genomic scaffold scaffold_33, whole genome shotgun sequence n=1 Tax=Paxillus rubicundulus Ve08.2h10 TaxID=930991 RepID=A0A0D0ECM0_9AGAM|nr:hypothetical protein PAXRUDRAFT_822601 [Paxillus rubicundulus Ve08.2h10]